MFFNIYRQKFIMKYQNIFILGIDKYYIMTAGLKWRLPHSDYSQNNGYDKGLPRRDYSQNNGYDGRGSSACCMRE